MDEHNNAIGRRIGERAKTYEDVVRLARAAILDGFERDGSGAGNTPVWLGRGNEPRDRPRSHAAMSAPADWPLRPVDRRGCQKTDERFRCSSEETSSGCLRRRAEKPAGDWTITDLRVMIADPANRTRTHRDHAACGGATRVAGHTRQGPSGPIQVRPITRSTARD